MSGEGFQNTGPLMKCHGAKCGSAHAAGMANGGGEVDTRGGCQCDDFAGGGIAHRNPRIAAAVPGSAYIALKVHRVGPRNRAQRPRNCASTCRLESVTATS